MALNLRALKKPLALFAFALCLNLFIMQKLGNEVLASPQVNKTVQSAGNNSPMQKNQPKVESENQKITRVYATHVVTGLCSQDLMVRYENLSWTAPQRSAQWKGYQTGCRCLATEILSVVEPYELIDFARLNFAEPPQKSQAPINQTRMNAISNLYYSPLLLKKCGLPQ